MADTGYIVCWSTGSLQGTLDDEHGDTKLFPTADAANSAARGDFAKMAALSVVHMNSRETFTDGMVSVSEPTPNGYAVWVEPAFWDGEEPA
jgi:hypothetical protein